jgi:hypothetical protein
MSDDRYARLGRKYAGVPLVLLLLFGVIGAVASELGYLTKAESQVASDYFLRSMPLAVGLGMLLERDASIGGRHRDVQITMKEQPVRFWFVVGGFLLIGMALLFSKIMS